jgi:hypothetical protein
VKCASVTVPLTAVILNQIKLFALTAVFAIVTEVPVVVFVTV